MTSHLYTPHTRRRRWAMLAVGASTALTLTACGGGSGSGSAGKPAAAASQAPKGVVDHKFAASLVDQYETMNNKANATQNTPLLATYEAGQLLEQDKADYVQFKTWPKKKQKDYRSKFTYQDRKYYIPGAGEGHWFAVTATSSDSPPKSRGLLIFDRVNGRYKLVMSVWEDQTPLPEIAVDRHGLAEAVDPSKRVGALAPDTLAPAYEDLFETGGAKEGKQLMPTPLSKDAVKIYRDYEKNGTADGHATSRFFATDPSDTSVYALRLANGGVLAIFPTAHRQESLVKERYRSSYELIPNKVQSLYSATRGAVITDVYQGAGIAELTPKSTRLIAATWQHTDSR